MQDLSMCGCASLLHIPIVVFEQTVCHCMLFHVQYVPLYAYICQYVSLGIHWWIYLLSPIILRFADGMYKFPLCLCASFYLSPVLVDWETDDHPLNPTLSLILLS